MAVVHKLPKPAPVADIAGTISRLSRSPHGHWTLHQLAAMIALRGGREVVHQDLAVELAMVAPGVTRVADKAETAGLMRRVEHMKDRRKVVLVLTPAGEEFVEWVLGGAL